MRLSDFDQYLCGEISPQRLSALIHDELEKHSAAAGKRGGVLPVFVDEDASVTITDSKYSVLLGDYAEGHFSAREIAYIADVIQLSEWLELSSRKLADYIFEMGDPEINGPFTVDRARAILSGLAT